MASGRLFTAVSFFVYDNKGNRYQYRLDGLKFIPEDVLESVRVFLVNYVVNTADWGAVPTQTPNSNALVLSGFGGTYSVK